MTFDVGFESSDILMDSNFSSIQVANSGKTQEKSLIMFLWNGFEKYFKESSDNNSGDRYSNIVGLSISSTSSQSIAQELIKRYDALETKISEQIDTCLFKDCYCEMLDILTLERDVYQTEALENGTTGSQGFSPTIEKEAIDGGNRLIITDINGTKTVDILNGVKGVDGKDGIPDYWIEPLETGAETINTALCNAGQNKSAFLFYTDAHWNYGSQMSPKLLKYLYYNTGMTKTNFGGDIVNDEGTDYDTMEYLWQWRKMVKDLPNHHSVVGNHDDGNTTNNLFSENYINGYLLAPEETENVVRGKKGLYYYIDHSPEKTRYLFLDTAYQGMNTHQQNFVKEALITTPNDWHIVAISHIWYDVNYDTTPLTVGSLNSEASAVLSIFDNYNSRIGEFADCGGWVEFCIGGHTHIDYDGTSTTGIPIILCETDSQHIRSELSYSLGTETESSINGIIADYTNHKIHVIRIGRGESREINVTNYLINYTNVIPLSTTNDGVTIYNADETPGYKANTKWSNSGNIEQTLEGTYITGYIPVSQGDIIRLKNVNLGTGKDSTCIVHMFRSLDDTNEASQNGTNLVTYNNAIADKNGFITQFEMVSDTYSYIRVQAGYIGSDSIITINEFME